MITCIREVRRAMGLTLLDVARRCDPPTTAQTIGRLETGTRTVSVGWLNRIAAALGVSASDLVRVPDRVELPIMALLGPDGAHPPARPLNAAPPASAAEMMAVKVEQSVGDYRAGDLIWCERIAAESAARALNRDILVPKAGGRMAFGRMIGLEKDRLLLLPLASGARQSVIVQPAWIGLAFRLVREL